MLQFIYHLKTIAFLQKRWKVKMEGKVLWFNNKKGYGFAGTTKENHIFLHYSNIKDGIDIKEGDEIIFDMVSGEKGLKAINIDKIKGVMI